MRALRLGLAVLLVGGLAFVGFGCGSASSAEVSGDGAGTPPEGDQMWCFNCEADVPVSPDAGETPPDAEAAPDAAPDAPAAPDGASADVPLAPDLGDVAEPECRFLIDCGAGYTCQNGRCVATGTCEERGTCPAPSGSGDIEVSPAEGLWFSYMPGTGVAIAQGLLIANAGEGDLEVRSVILAAGAPDFQLTVQPTWPLLLHQGEMERIEVTFQEISPLPRQGLLVLRTNDPDEAEVRVDLVPQPKGPTAEPEPCIQITPSVLNFGSVVRGTAVERSFTIRSCGDATLVVQTIRRGSGFFGMLPLSEEFQLTPPPAGQLLLQPGQEHTQTVTFTAGLAGVKNGHWEVVNNDPDQGTARVEVNAESQAPPIETQGIHVQLEWDSDNCDVDTHFLRPGADFNNIPGDCFYMNMSPDWGTAGDFVDDPFLDVDNVWGYGPENVNIQEPQPGTYKIIIYYYRDSYNDSPSTDTRATVRVYHYGQLAATFGPTYLASTGWTWDVCTIDWPSLTITTLGQVYQ